MRFLSIKTEEAIRNDTESPAFEHRRGAVADILDQLGAKKRYRRFLRNLKHQKKQGVAEAVLVFENLSEIKACLHRFSRIGSLLTDEERERANCFLELWDIHVHNEEKGIVVVRKAHDGARRRVKLHEPRPCVHRRTLPPKTFRGNIRC